MKTLNELGIHGLAIDSHLHTFHWGENPGFSRWTEQPGFEFLRRDIYTVNQFGPLFAKLGIRGCVAVEFGHGDLEETEWFDKQGPTILAITSTIDPTSAVLANNLAMLASMKRVKAVRVIAQDNARAFYDNARFQAGVRKIGQSGFVFELLIKGHEFPSALKIVDACPDTRFVLDHIGKPPLLRGGEPQFAEWERGIRELAKRQNVIGCKTSGTTTEGSREQMGLATHGRFLRVAYEAFGIDRLLYGSDSPMFREYCDYAAVLQLQIDFFESLGLSAAEAAKYFYENAQRIYGIEPK